MPMLWDEDESEQPKESRGREWRQSGGVYRTIDEVTEPRRRPSMISEVMRSLAEIRAK